MVSKGDDKVVIWPIYFDRSVSRQEGRKVAKKHAIEKPSIENIAKAAQSLGLHPVIQKDSIHPSRPWKKEGRILIDKKDSKSKQIKQIANRM